MRSSGAEAAGVKAVPFDLDGAVPDGAAGMLASPVAACRVVGLDERPPATVRGLDGAPIEESTAAHRDRRPPRP